jgi:hypothetical protein
MEKYFEKHSCYFILFSLFLFLYAPYAQAQQINKDNVIELKELLRRNDKLGICKLLGNQLSENRINLIESSMDEIYERADITVFTSESKKMTAHVAQSPFIMVIPFGSTSIDSFQIKLERGIKPIYQINDSWKPGDFIHIVLKVAADQVLPPNIDPFSCPKPCSGGFLDKPAISIPFTHKKFSPITASLGAITGVSLIWFFNERNNADKFYKQYSDAVFSKDAVDLRCKINLSRSCRDLAGGISIASGITFISLLVQDIFFRNCNSEIGAAFIPVEEIRGKPHLSLKPQAYKEEITLSLSVNF